MKLEGFGVACGSGRILVDMGAFSRVTGNRIRQTGKKGSMKPKGSFIRMCVRCHVCFKSTCRKAKVCPDCDRRHESVRRHD